MCDMCGQWPCAPGCPSAGDYREHRICAWCDNPVFGGCYYDVDGDTVCTDCMDACRRYEYQR